LCCFLPLYAVKFFGLLFGALGCLVEDGPFTRLRRMQVPRIESLAIYDSNKVDSTNTLIVVVEGQDIPNEVVPFHASIDPSRLVVKGEDLQSVEH
jgi:hypothetical protein